MSDSTKVLTKGVSGYILYNVSQNRMINVYDGLTFGRIEGAELFSNDPLVSRIHCRIHVQGIKVFVEDLGSSNKTKVNGKEITSNTQISLSIGDRLEIGNQQLILQRAGQRPTAFEPVTMQFQSSEPFTEVVKSFFKFKEVRHSTRLIFSIVLLIAFAVFQDFNRTQCMQNLTPYGMSFFYFEVLPKLLLTGMFFCFINHFLIRRFKFWSLESILIGTGSFLFATIFTIVIAGSQEHLPSVTNQVACRCITSNESKELSVCSTWVHRGQFSKSEIAETKIGKLIHYSGGVYAFQSLPKETQSAINKNLALYLNQTSPSALPTSLSQFPVSPTPTPESTFQPESHSDFHPNVIPSPK